MSVIGELIFYDESDTDVYELQFINLEFPDGWAWDIWQRVASPVTGMGVDGTRMRLVRNDAPPFRLSGISAFATFDDAVQAGIASLSYKAYRGSLTFTAAGVSYALIDKCYIWDVAAKPMAAQLASTIADPTSAAILETHFRLQACKIS